MYVVIISSSIFYLSELAKFEFIITTFDHRSVYLSPILRINVFHIKCVLRLSEHGDVIETQTISFVPQSFLANSVPGLKNKGLNEKIV